MATNLFQCKAELQKLSSLELDLVLSEAKSEYNNCMQSRYFPAYDRYQTTLRNDPKTKEVFVTEEVVQSCVLAGVVSGANKAMDTILPSSLAEFIPDFVERQKNINELLANRDQCFKEQKLTTQTQYFKSFNMRV